jgi:membrane-bound lytic murein transglycosylase D
MPGDMDVALIARLAEVPLEDFKALNPSAHRPVLLAGGTSQILLPWDNAEIFQRNIDTYAGRLASWTVWVAPQNMKVADAAKRYSMAEEEFRSINKIPPRMLIKAGSALLVPRSAKQQNDVSAKVADNGQLNLTPETSLRKQTVKARKNESMQSLAKRYKVNVEQLAQWNNLSANSALRPGQRLTIMVPGRPKKFKSTASSSKRKKANQ